MKVLENKTEITLGYFMTGLYCIVLSSGLKAFIQYSLLNASIVCAGLVMMTYILVDSGRRIFKNMYVDKVSAKTGKIDRINDPTNIKLN